MKTILSSPGLMLFALVFLSGCASTPTRECPAFFHPDLLDWTPEQEGDSVRLVAASGKSVTYAVSDLVRSEPFIQTGDDARPTVLTCKLTAQRRYKSLSVFPHLDFYYSHGDWLNVELADELFMLELKPVTKSGQTLPQKFLFVLKNNSESDRTGTEYVHEYITEYKAGGIKYNHVIASAWLNRSAFAETMKLEHQIVKVWVARGAGLIQIKFSNGQVFTREP